MIVIQTTSFYDKTVLEAGLDFDFLSNAKFIKGIQILESNSNTPLEPISTIEILIDREVYIPKTCPVLLMQSSFSVAPNDRFFTLGGHFGIVNKKVHLKCENIPSLSKLRFIFLLEK